MFFRLLFATFFGLVLLLSTFSVAFAQDSSIVDLDEIERYVLPPVDLLEIRQRDEKRVALSQVPHYAVALTVEIDPWEYGAWEPRARGEARWRLRVQSPGALSLNFAFRRFFLPAGGRLYITPAAGGPRIGPFTALDNDEHGELWTPPILSDDLVLELIVPVAALEDLELELTSVQHGYAGFGEEHPKSGTCNVDVACREGDAWRDQTRAVALISIEGVRFCSGFLVNNTALDGVPYMITAHHCGVSHASAPSIVAMWNHQMSACQRARADAARSAAVPGHFQTGAKLRAAYRRTDTILLELDDPPAAEFDVFYAGWDRRSVAPEATVVIHHPNTDAKKISVDYDRALTTPHLRDDEAAWGAHLRVGAWDLGTTEGGSSGAPLFNPEGRVVGQLHGGYAACGNRRPDWFGRFADSWSGGGRPAQRLSDWLDPLGSDAPTLDGVDGLIVLPAAAPGQESIRPAR